MKALILELGAQESRLKHSDEPPSDEGSAKDKSGEKGSKKDQEPKGKKPKLHKARGKRWKGNVPLHELFMNIYIG